MLTFIRKHLVWKIIITVTACISIVSTFSAAYFYDNYKKQILIQFQMEIEDIKNIIEGGYPIHLWNIQYDVIKQLNETILSGSPYVAILVYDKSINGEYGLNLSTTKKEFDNINEYIHGVSKSNIEEKDVEITHGFIVYDDETIGKYELYYSKRHIYAQLNNYLYSISASFLFISLAIIAMLVLLLNKFVIKKLFSIVGFARNVAVEKRYEKRIFVHGDDEIGILAGSINDMLEQIELKDRQKDEAGLKLSRSEAYLKSIFDACPDAIFILDSESWNILDVNDSAVAIYGGHRLDLLGRDFAAFSNTEAGAVGQWLAKTKSEGPQRFEQQARRLDGSLFWAAFHVNFTLIGGESRFIVMTRDVTRHKQAEEDREKLQVQLLQAQKMEAVGTLAGGVAHDFNNLLQAMSGNIQLLQRDKPEDASEAKRLNIVSRSIDRAAKLVRQLLLFSRKAVVKREQIDLNLVVTESVAMLERTIPRMIHVETHLAADLWPIAADPVQVEQVLLNLGSNAADAMPDGGRLTFQTENVNLAPDFARTHLEAEPGPYVLLSVTDTGCGMDKETREQIFDPFFTTKDVGKGTGLGLAMVYGIVKNHGGNVLCYSEPSQGTTFRIYWPAALDQTTATGHEPEPDLQAAPAVREPSGGRETILVVDDEADILELTAEALQSLGYVVLTASSGEEALALYAENRAGVDLVIMDLGMPGMGGRQCLRELVRLDARVRVLVASGYAAANLSDEVRRDGAAGFIAKPYQLTELTIRVREILETTNRS